MIGEIKNGNNQLTCDRRIKRQESVDRFTAFEQIYQALNRNPCIAEARRAAHALGINPDCFVKFLSLQARHPSTLTAVRCNCKRLFLRSNPQSLHLPVQITALQT
jgi:hypothetical protein